MLIRKASAVWEGNLPKGHGTFNSGTGIIKGKYSATTRFGEEPGTNPEELIAAAHASCFSMAFANELDKAGFTPTSVRTTAKVHLEKVDNGFKITTILLSAEGDVPGIDSNDFLKYAEIAKTGCPVSKALTGATIQLEAKLLNSEN